MLKIRTMSDAEVSEIANGAPCGVQEGDSVLVAQCAHMPAPVHFPFPSPAHMLQSITEAARAAGTTAPLTAPPPPIPHEKMLTMVMQLLQPYLQGCRCAEAYWMRHGDEHTICADQECCLYVGYLAHQSAN